MSQEQPTKNVEETSSECKVDGDKKMNQASSENITALLGQHKASGIIANQSEPIGLQVYEKPLTLFLFSNSFSYFCYFANMYVCIIY